MKKKKRFFFKTSIPLKFNNNNILRNSDLTDDSTAELSSLEFMRVDTPFTHISSSVSFNFSQSFLCHS